jgi:hypothetical protein
VNKIVLSPSQNISKSESKKFDVFSSKFGPNTLNFVDKLLLYFETEGLFWYFRQLILMTKSYVMV